MAKATAKTQSEAVSTPAAETTTSTAPVVVQENVPAVVREEIDFAQDAGRGMEGATPESFAIPFLLVLQKGSPQVDEASGAMIEGARAGMLYENVTGRLFDGKAGAGVVIVPCYYRRVFLRWGPKGSPAGGFKGELLPEVVAEMRLQRKIVELDNKLYVPLHDGTINEKTCDRIADVRNHYVLLIDETTGAWNQSLISLGSTQIKKSKNLMSQLASVKIKTAGGMVQPATYANKVRMTTLAENNDKGTWMGVKFEVIGRVDSKDIYNAAKAFHETVKKGSVEVKYEDTADDAHGGQGPVDPTENRF